MVIKDIPKQYQKCINANDSYRKVKMHRLLDALEENDDVQDVWHNLENEDEL